MHRHKHKKRCNSSSSSSSSDKKPKEQPLVLAHKIVACQAKVKSLEILGTPVHPALHIQNIIEEQPVEIYRVNQDNVYIAHLFLIERITTGATIKLNEAGQITFIGSIINDHFIGIVQVEIFVTSIVSAFTARLKYKLPNVVIFANSFDLAKQDPLTLFGQQMARVGAACIDMKIINHELIVDLNVQTDDYSLLEMLSRTLPVHIPVIVPGITRFGALTAAPVYLSIDIIVDNIGTFHGEILTSGICDSGRIVDTNSLTYIEDVSPAWEINTDAFKLAPQDLHIKQINFSWPGVNIRDRAFWFYYNTIAYPNIADLDSSPGFRPAKVNGQSDVVTVIATNYDSLYINSFTLFQGNTFVMYFHPKRTTAGPIFKQDGDVFPYVKTTVVSPVTWTRTN